MKIEINIDVEALVKEAIKEYIKENLVINNTGEKIHIQHTVTAEDKVQVTLNSEQNAPKYAVDWEYAPQAGKRRNKVQKALHEKELSLGRLLTPQEKGEIEGKAEVDDIAEQKAKEDVIEKARIEKLAKEGTDAAVKEIEKENKPLTNSSLFTDESSELDKAEKEAEATTPEAEELDDLQKLFS